MAFDYTAFDVDLTDLTDCSDLITERTGLTLTDAKLLLGISAGTDPSGTTVYRPYYATARILADRRTQLKSGEGATFVDPLDVARQLMATQAAIDARLSLTVPSGMEATLRDPAARAVPSGAADAVGSW